MKNDSKSETLKNKKRKNLYFRLMRFYVVTSKGFKPPTLRAEI